MDSGNAITDYMAGRLLTPDLPKDGVAIAVKTLADYFGAGWLQSSQSHPIRKLWRSLDEFSTQELYWLGDSIRLISELDDKWVRDAVKTSKLPDTSRSGTVFERGSARAQEERRGAVEHPALTRCDHEHAGT